MTDSNKQTTQTNKQIAQAGNQPAEAGNKPTQVGNQNAQSEQNEAKKSSIDDTTIQISPEQAAPSVGTGKSQGFFRGLFDDLSMAQVIAGALAAATVFLLSSVIGVAGSLIGAAIGSVISAVSSQVYKKALSASADKLRDASSTTLLSGSDDISGEAAASKKAQVDEGGGQPLTSPMETSAISDATRVMNANDIRYASSYNQGEDPALKRAHARRSRKAKVQRQVLIVSVVSSLVAIVICACVITFATQGEGIGTKTDPILPSITSQSHSSHSSSAADSSDQDREGSASTSDPSSDNTTSSNDETTQGSGSTNDQGSTGDSNTTGGSNNSGTSGGSDTTGGSGSGSGSGTGSGSSDSGQTGGGSNMGSGSSSGSGSGTTDSGSSNYQYGF